jgi:heme-degrading monooxygenase HmoA
MVYIHVRHRVEDYARWREGFDRHIPAREAGGATDEVLILRDVDDPNEIVVIVGWRDLAQARAFAQSASLKEAMQKSGVAGPPEVRFLQAAD